MAAIIIIAEYENETVSLLLTPPSARVLVAALTTTITVTVANQIILPCLFDLTPVPTDRRQDAPHEGQGHLGVVAGVVLAAAAVRPAGS